MEQIPLCDNLLQIKMPPTPLTDILQDFRSYRPGNHRQFLEWVQNRASTINLQEFALKDKYSSGKRPTPAPHAQPGETRLMYIPCIKPQNCISTR